jgi:hypothetical protein
MERQRSPSYPSLSLPQAIDMVEKLHKANRTSVISRETAAKDMGYAGLTGRSLTVLAALAQFGLVERAGKGDIKVSRRAVDILHSVDEADKAEAIQEAAFAPALFQQLRERFPEGVPSQNALRSYLIQRDFGDVAIGPAITSFLETNAFVENAKETGRTGDSLESPADSVHRDEPEIIMHHQPTAMPLNPVPVPPFATLQEASLNKITMNIQGDRVLVSGLFDLRGLKALKRKIEGLEALLAPDEELADGADDNDL